MLLRVVNHTRRRWLKQAMAIAVAALMAPASAAAGQTYQGISLQKAVTLSGKTFRADVLNLSDNPLFSGPVGTYGTSNFGQITVVNGFARSVQFQARVAF
jgi:hypothetical protein